MTRDLDLTADVIDIRDIIARVEEMETTCAPGAIDASDETDYPALMEELSALEAILADLCGAGVDEQWRGSWYPVTLIRDSYFRTYAEELAEDIGAVNPDASWPNNCIDWDKAARELQYDYTTVDIDGVTYWYR